jgi:hypothetical protein
MSIQEELDDLPVKNKIRAQRRHNRQRMIKKAEKLVNRDFYYSKDFYNEDYLSKTARKMADNPTKCSCEMCSRTRKLIGETIQERKNEISFKEDLTM